MFHWSVSKNSHNDYWKHLLIWFSDTPLMDSNLESKRFYISLVVIVNSLLIQTFHDYKLCFYVIFFEIQPLYNADIVFWYFLNNQICSLYTLPSDIIGALNGWPITNYPQLWKLISPSTIQIKILIKTIGKLIKFCVEWGLDEIISPCRYWIIIWNRKK